MPAHFSQPAPRQEHISFGLAARTDRTTDSKSVTVSAVSHAPHSSCRSDSKRFLAEINRRANSSMGSGSGPSYLFFCRLCSLVASCSNLAVILSSLPAASAAFSHTWTFSSSDNALSSRAWRSLWIGTTWATSPATISLPA